MTQDEEMALPDLTRRRVVALALRGGIGVGLLGAACTSSADDGPSAGAGLRDLVG